MAEEKSKLNTIADTVSGWFSSKPAKKKFKTPEEEKAEMDDKSQMSKFAKSTKKAFE